MPRKKLTATVRAGHHNYTGMSDIAETADVRYLDVQVPELGWLHKVTLDFDAKTGAVQIRVYPADENSPVNPTLTVTENAFRLNS